MIYGKCVDQTQSQSQDGAAQVVPSDTKIKEASSCSVTHIYSQQQCAPCFRCLKMVIAWAITNQQLLVDLFCGNGHDNVASLEAGLLGNIKYSSLLLTFAVAPIFVYSYSLTYQVYGSNNDFHYGKHNDNNTMVMMMILIKARQTTAIFF